MNNDSGDAEPVRPESRFENPRSGIASQASAEIDVSDAITVHDSERRLRQQSCIRDELSLPVFIADEDFFGVSLV